MPETLKLTEDQNASLDAMKADLEKASSFLTSQGAPPQATPGVTVPDTITSESLAPAAPMPYATPNPVPIYPVDSLDTSLPPLEATQSEKDASDVSKRLQALNDSLVGRSAFQAQQDNAAGLPDLYKTQTDLTSKLKAIQNEAKAIPLLMQQQAEGRGITAAGLAPIQASESRRNAIEALTVSTLLEATRGNIATAQAMADRVVAQKYGPIEEQITAAKANLELIMNDPKATLEEKNRAQAQLNIQNKKQAALDALKENSKEIFKIATDAAKNNADAITLDRISKAKTKEEALRIAVEAGVAVEEDTQLTDIGGRRVLINTKTGEVIKDLGSTKAPGDGSPAKVYDAKNLPGDVRSDVLATFTDAATQGTALTLQDMAAMFPEINLETLKSLMDEFYVEPEDTTPRWWEFWK
jgi:hypothetical protein